MALFTSTSMSENSDIKLFNDLTGPVELGLEPRSINTPYYSIAEGQQSNSKINTDVEMTDRSLNQVENSVQAGGDCVLPTAVTVQDESSSSDMASDNFYFNAGQVGWSDLSSSGQIPQLNETGGGYQSFDGCSTAAAGMEDVQMTQKKFGQVSVNSLPPPPLGLLGPSSNKPVLGEGTFKIFVSGFPEWFRNEDLAKLFQPYGRVLECEIFFYKNFAFVHLDSEEGRKRAIRDLNNVELEGSKLSVQKSTAVNPNQKNRNVDTLSTSRSSADEVGSYKLYISNLQMGVTKEPVTKILERYGRIVEIEIYRNNSAFVHMEEEAAGKKIIQELDQQVVPEIGGPLSVSESKNPEGPSLPTIKLQVKNIGNSATADMIRSLFQPYGMVVKCSISNSSFNLLRRAVVHLEQLGDIRSAIQNLSGYDLDGNKLIVEPLFEEEKQPSLQNQRKKPAQNMPEKNYSPSPNPFGFNEYHINPSPSRGRGRGRGGFSLPQPGRGRGQFQLIPMPSSEDISQMPTLAGRGRGRGRGMGRPHQGFVPRQPKRPYQNFGFDQDQYEFDEYYEDPKAASSREHIAGLQDQYNPYENETFQQSDYGPGDYQPMGYPYGESEREYHPPPKKPRGKPGGVFNALSGSSLPSLMGINVQHTSSTEEVVKIPYQRHKYPSVNLPLGEREYFSNFKQGNKTQQQANSSYSGAQRNQFPPSQHFQQSKAQQQDSSYFCSDQIPNPSGSGSNNSGFQYSTAYPSNYYAGVDNFSAVPFDYNTMKQKNKGPHGQHGLHQPAATGSNPTGTPLKQGARMYVNGNGKVMVRGNRGGKKARRPGLGSKGNKNKTSDGINNSANGEAVSVNQLPLGPRGPTAGPSNSNNFYQNHNAGSSAGGNSKFKSKQQVKDDNQEYSDWLQRKPWLYQAIPGTVRPANK